MSEFRHESGPPSIVDVITDACVPDADTDASINPRCYHPMSDLGCRTCAQAEILKMYEGETCKPSSKSSSLPLPDSASSGSEPSSSESSEVGYPEMDRIAELARQILDNTDPGWWRRSASATPVDWTTGPNGGCNNSELFLKLVKDIGHTVENTRVGDSGEDRARLILARLTHLHDFGPRSATWR